MGQVDRSCVGRDMTDARGQCLSEKGRNKPRAYKHLILLGLAGGENGLASPGTPRVQRSRSVPGQQGSRPLHLHLGQPATHCVLYLLEWLFVNPKSIPHLP